MPQRYFSQRTSKFHASRVEVLSWPLCRQDKYFPSALTASCRGAHEAEALPEELSHDGSCPEAVS